MLKKINPVIPVLSVLLLTSCTGSRYLQINDHNSSSNCSQKVFTYDVNDLPPPFHEIQIDTTLTNRLSFQALNAAHAIGLIKPIQELIHLKNKTGKFPNLEERIEMAELKQGIFQKINSSVLEISALASEMDCEEERADQIAVFMKSKEEESVTKITVAAIIIGAMGSVTSGILLANNRDTDSPEVIGITTGFIETVLGMMILTQKRKIAFYHHRNALRDVWYNPPVSGIFPPPVWYYLNYTNQSGNEQSIIQQLRNKWSDFGQIADAKKKKRAKLHELFFGDGGIYTADQLINRANMYDQVEAHINLMKQDLRILALEIENL